MSWGGVNGNFYCHHELNFNTTSLSSHRSLLLFLSVFLLHLTFPAFFSSHKLPWSNPYFVRMQIRPHCLKNRRSTSPYLLSLPANQPLSSGASLNAKDAVTCLAFPPWCCDLGFAEVSQGLVRLAAKFVCVCVCMGGVGSKQ